MKDLDPNARGGYIVPPTEQSMDEPPGFARRANWWVRGGSCSIAAALALVFYHRHPGAAVRRRRQSAAVGLAPVARHAGLPVQGDDRPAVPVVRDDDQLRLLVRGDVVNSLRANWVGTRAGRVLRLVDPVVPALVGARAFLWVRRH